MNTRGGCDHAVEDQVHARGRAEEERAADAVDHDVARHHLAAIGRPAVLVVGHVVADKLGAAFDVDRLRHAMHEQERAEQHADADAGEQIEEYREQEGREQHHRVGERGAQQQAELGLVRHPPGDDDQHAGQRGQRDIGDERHRDEDEDQEIKRMHHAGDRTARAGADIGRGARNRAGHRHAAADRRRDIADALRDQFAVRAMAPSRHAVGDDGREQRFDRAQNRDGDRVGQPRPGSSRC